MSKRQGLNPEAEAASVPDEHEPRPMTLRQNVILTIKVLAGFGAMGLALWGLTVWKAVE